MYIYIYIYIYTYIYLLLVLCLWRTLSNTEFGTKSGSRKSKF